MSWQQLVQWLISDRLAEMTERVAGRSRLAVWQRVAERLDTLAAGEVRGYIRSRAAAVIETETDRLIEQEGTKVGRMRERIVATASQSLVETIAAQIRDRRAQSAQCRAA